MSNYRRRFTSASALFIAVTAVGLSPTAALAFPNKSIRLVVSYPPRRRGRSACANRCAIR